MTSVIGNGTRVQKSSSPIDILSVRRRDADRDGSDGECQDQAKDQKAKKPSNDSKNQNRWSTTSACGDALTGNNSTHGTCITTSRTRAFAPEHDEHESEKRECRGGPKEPNAPDDDDAVFSSRRIVAVAVEENPINDASDVLLDACTRLKRRSRANIRGRRSIGRLAFGRSDHNRCGMRPLLRCIVPLVVKPDAVRQFANRMSSPVRKWKPGTYPAGCIL